MSLLRTAQRARQAVGFFNIKHFHSRQKFVLTPDNVTEVFRTQLRPTDRLLRQARVGGGATRVLVVDKNQRVKGIYNPLLCLPHPAVVPHGESVLGVTVKEYLDTLAEVSDRHSSAAERAATSAFALPTATTQTSSHVSPSPSTMVILSHPNGVAVACFAADGSLCMPLQNETTSIHELDMSTTSDQVNSVTSSLTSPTSGRQSLVRLINAHYDSCLSACRTFFFLSRDGARSLSLRWLEQQERQQQQRRHAATTDKADNAAQNAQGRASGEAAANDESHAELSRISFADPRWIVLPDTVLHSSHNLPLYSRDRATRERIVNAEGLRAGVTHGVLFLDVIPQNETAPSVS